VVWGQRSEEIGAELQWATQSFSGGAVEDLDGVVAIAELAEDLGAVAEGMTSAVTVAMTVAMTAVAVTTVAVMVVVVVVTLILRALDDATEDPAEDAAEEGLTGGGGLGGSGLGVGDGNDLRGSRSDGLNARDTGDFKAGHVNGGFEEEFAGLTGEAVVVEGSGLGVGGDGQERGAGKSSGGDASKALTEEGEGSHGKSV